MFSKKVEDIFNTSLNVERYGLTLPRAIYIANKLRENGLPIKENILTEQDLTEELCKLLVKN